MQSYRLVPALVVNSGSLQGLCPLCTGTGRVLFWGSKRTHLGAFAVCVRCSVGNCATRRRVERDGRRLG